MEINNHVIARFLAVSAFALGVSAAGAAARGEQDEPVEGAPFSRSADARKATAGANRQEPRTQPIQPRRFPKSPEHS